EGTLAQLEKRGAHRSGKASALVRARRYRSGRVLPPRSAHSRASGLVRCRHQLQACGGGVHGVFGKIDGDEFYKPQSAEFDFSVRCLKPRFQSYTRAWNYSCVCAETLERATHPFGIRVLDLK